MSRVVAIGVRVKSGWAAAVVLGGPTASPAVVESRRLELSDGAVPATRQPYHAGMGTAQTSAVRIARLTRIVARCAQRSVGELVASCRKRGFEVRGVGIVVGSDIDPRRIANPHIRAHASEGLLFRTVVERAARRHGVKSSVVRERDVFRRGAEALQRPETGVKGAVAAFGAPLAGPWRAEQKSAAAAAWLVLARRPL
jgi:hypothetical protein